MRHLVLLTLLSLVVVQFACNNHTNGKAATPLKVYNNGVNIAYTDNGKGDTTLLFVHGWCINKGYWLNQLNYFSKRYRVVAVDLPGFGHSGKNRKEYNSAIFGSDIDSVITQLKLDKVILIGHSMAGDIVLQAAINAPDKVIGLVGVDNFKSVGGPAPSRKDSVSYSKAIDSLRHDFRIITFEYFNHDLFSKTTPDSIKKRILNDVAKVDTVIAADCMVMDNFSELAGLKKAGKKLYLINSDIGKTDTSNMSKSRVPFQINYIHGVGHFPMIETPAEFNKALDKIIREI